MKTLIRIAMLAAMLTASVTGVMAHHGWTWTTGGNIDLTGIVREASLGNPHGVLEVDADGEIWTVEVGQPWRNERAGLRNGDLVPGVEIRVIGEPASDPSIRRMKAETFYLGEREFVLYPERD